MGKYSSLIRAFRVYKFGVCMKGNSFLHIISVLKFNIDEKCLLKNEKCFFSLLFVYCFVSGEHLFSDPYCAVRCQQSGTNVWQLPKVFRLLKDGGGGGIDKKTLSLKYTYGAADVQTE